ARGDRAEKLERCLPRCNVNSTASSLSASESRSFSERNNSTSTASADAGRPGLAEANAANAASLASARNRMITLTSTPYFRAASALRDLLGGDLQKQLPLLLRRQLPASSPLAVLHHHVLLVSGPN